MAVRTVNDIPDAELLRRAVRSAVRKRRPRSTVAWSAISRAFMLGSGFSVQLCRRFGVDPETGDDTDQQPASGEVQ